LIVDCELDCQQKGLSPGMSCNYELCHPSDPSCWDPSGGGNGKAKSCGPKCDYGITGFSISTVSSVTGPSTCQNYLNLKKSIDEDIQGFASLRNDFPGQYPAKLKSCCGILKESVVCLSPSAVIGVVGGYLSILLSIFQVLFILVSKLRQEDVFKKVYSIYLILITIITITTFAIAYGPLSTNRSFWRL